MDNYYFIEAIDGKFVAGCVENGRLLRIEKEDKPSVEKDIFRVRINDINQGLGAAFVDIGSGVDAYLPLKASDIKSGDTILAQVVRDAYDEKGAKLERDISIDGRYIVLTPFSSGIKASKRLKDSVHIREALLSKRQFEYGFVLRNASKISYVDDIIAEYKHLSDIYTELIEQLNFLPVPKLLYSHGNFVERFLRRENSVDCTLFTNDIGVAKIAKSFGSIEVVYDAEYSLKYDSVVMRALSRLSQKIVELDCGGWISIEQTNALTAIDVNVGSAYGCFGKYELERIVNFEAAFEIGEQIRLRNISGIIVVDFAGVNIDYEKDIERELKHSLKNDPNAPRLCGFTRAGLYEITRKRSGDMFEASKII